MTDDLTLWREKPATFDAWVRGWTVTTWSGAQLGIITSETRRQTPVRHPGTVIVTRYIRVSGNNGGIYYGRGDARNEHVRLFVMRDRKAADRKAAKLRRDLRKAATQKSPARAPASATGVMK